MYTLTETEGRERLRIEPWLFCGCIEGKPDSVEHMSSLALSMNWWEASSPFSPPSSSPARVDRRTDQFLQAQFCFSLPARDCLFGSLTNVGPAQCEHAYGPRDVKVKRRRWIWRRASMNSTQSLGEHETWYRSSKFCLQSGWI